MWRIEVPGSRALLTPGLDELSVLVELHDARIRVSAVPVCNEDVAVGRSDDIRRLIECVLALAGDSRFAQRQQDLSFRAKLYDEVALACGPGRCGGCTWRNAVGDPDISLPVDVYSVRKGEHSFAKAL